MSKIFRSSSFQRVAKVFKRRGKKDETNAADAEPDAVFRTDSEIVREAAHVSAAKSRRLSGEGSKLRSSTHSVPMTRTEQLRRSKEEPAPPAPSAPAETAEAEPPAVEAIEAEPPSGWADDYHPSSRQSSMEATADAAALPSVAEANAEVQPPTEAAAAVDASDEHAEEELVALAEPQPGTPEEAEETALEPTPGPGLEPMPEAELTLENEPATAPEQPAPALEPEAPELELEAAAAPRVAPPTPAQSAEFVEVADPEHAPGDDDAAGGDDAGGKAAGAATSAADDEGDPPVDPAHAEYLRMAAAEAAAEPSLFDLMQRFQRSVSNVLLSPRVVRCLGVEAPPSPAKSPSKSPVKAAQQAVAPSTEPEVSLVPAAAASELAAVETPSPPPTRRSSIFSQASEDALTGRQKALYKDLSDLKAEAREYAEVAWQRASRASRASHARADSWLNQESSESVLG